MKRIWTISVIMYLMVLATVDLYGQQSREIILAGYNEVPPVRTPASGVAEITLEADTLVVSGRFMDLSGRYWSAAIYHGSRDERGNKLLSLKVDLDESRTGGVLQAHENRFTLTGGLKEALRDGMLYISIASERRQRGEIRGQLPSMP